ncbi:MAG TPA: XRE family transcriptional regulator [Spirochaetaceae bacterium]|nr:XRE family transcriptional regulator [Spirochaetaceae bacterium]
MIRAYNALYLSDAQIFLANAFDYALNDCGQEPDWFGFVFARSAICRRFETGSPAVISGKSGKEDVRELLQTIVPDEEFPPASFSQERSSAYWAGWALAYYQWFTVKRFKDIFIRVPLSEILLMHKLYHEMDLTNFVEELDRRYDSVVLETKLKKIRESRGLSQAQLAEMSGVAKRSIQLYEQRVNDIDKSQGQTLYKLSRVLGCDIEDLLESPEK